MQPAPKQRAQHRQHGVAVQDDRVGSRSAERRADAGVVDRSKADSLDRIGLGQEFVGVAAGQISRPGDVDIHLAIEGLVEARSARRRMTWRSSEGDRARARDRAARNIGSDARRRPRGAGAAHTARSHHATSISALRSTAPLSLHQRRATSRARRLRQSPRARSGQRGESLDRRDPALASRRAAGPNRRSRRRDRATASGR